jgi:hypothetical protein
VVTACADAGFYELYVNQIAPGQDAFVAACGELCSRAFADRVRLPLGYCCWRASTSSSGVVGRGTVLS